MKTNKYSIILKLIISFLLIASYSNLTAQTTTTIPSGKGEWKVTTNGNHIKIEFNPDKDSVNCSKIGFVQTVKMTFYNTTTGVATQVAPSDILPKWSYRDKDTIPGGTYVDHTFCEKDPAYNGDDVPQDHVAGGTTGQGSSNGTTTAPSSMSDRPNLGDGAFPAGQDSVVMEFETCAICMGGTDAGTNYGCITWRYTKKKGGAGASVLVPAVGPPPVRPPSAGFTAALAQFVSTHTSGTDSICPEELPVGDCGKSVSGVDGPLLFHVNSSYEVKKAGKDVKKGPLPPDGPGSNGLPSDPLPAGATIDSCTYVYVPKGQKIELARVIPSTPSGTSDSSIPFPGTFGDLFQGMWEIVESGFCFGAAHGGIKAQTCSRVTLAAAAPQQTSNPLALIMFTGRIDDVNDLVIFKNDALSSGPIQCVNLFNGNNNFMPPPVSFIFPGDSIVYAFPGMITSCIAPYTPTITLSPTNSTCSNGSITSAVSGGLAPFNYLWSNGATTADLAGLSLGTYTVTMMDAHSLTATASATITGPSALILTLDSVKNLTCPGGNDGYLSFHASGGTGGYTYGVSKISPVTCCVSNDCGINPDFSCQTCECKSSTAGPYTNLSEALFVITVTDANSCSTSASVNITPPASLSCNELTGTPVSLCAAGAGTGSYSVPLHAGMHYNWSTPSGMTISSGQGTNTINVLWTSLAANNGIKGNVCVNGIFDNCALPPITCCLAVGINVVKPVQPNSISGPAKVCPGDVVTYSVAAVARSTAYNWSLPSGMSITNGAGSNIISVSVDAGFTGGTLSVAASNACGIGNARTKTLSLNTPLTPGTITGPLNGQCGATGILYSIAPVSNASGYEWTVSGGTNMGPNGGTTFYFSWAFFDVFYSVSVVAQNGCGNSLPRSITVNGKPGLPGAITGPVNVCTNSTQHYSIATVTGASLYTWTSPAPTIIGQGAKEVDMQYSMSPFTNQVITVKASNGCGIGPAKSLSGITAVGCGRLDGDDNDNEIIVYPNPAFDELNVLFSSIDGEPYQLQLIDITGRIAFTEKGTATGLIVPHVFNVNQLPKGMYLIQLITNRGNWQEKVILE